MADDRSLLDRLNALKPTSVSLEKEEPKLSLSALSTEPTSKEDALSARLRTLRNASASPRSPQRESDTRPQAQPQPVIETPSSPLGKPQPPSRPSEDRQEDTDVEGDDDALFHTDDRTLDEFLESLDLNDDVAPDQPPPLTSDHRDEEKKVAALLEELKPSSSDLGPPRRGKDDKEDDDDSEGEEMSAQVRQVLSRALDEAELDQSLSAPPDTGQDEAHHAASPPEPEAGIPNPHDQSSSQADTDAAPPLSLPTVPSQLVDPVPPQTPLDFESSIAARMARLKGISYGATSSDTFGLPQAPSFNPDSRSESKPSASSFAGKPSGGYTDEDQKTWCVVCLEDATIRCVGCDDDVYCARCWRDMHVGPRAGWDERGHKWVRFERGK